ncbi:MAG: hypothetical protein KatS3mg105_2808 [Gemmatales bacterium]|nr:MAG: hypothetical protein KatS3mg105_2808 [Gemmatales bacterium]
MDARTQRDGKVIEELGLYDPTIPNTDERVKLKADRIKYWLSVGAKPTEKLDVLLRKYLAKFEQAAAELPQQEAAGSNSAPTETASES